MIIDYWIVHDCLSIQKPYDIVYQGEAEGVSIMERYLISLI